VVQQTVMVIFGYLQILQISGFMHNKFLKLVMGLINKDNTQNITPVSQQDQLNAKELEFLLLIIKETSFKGELVETVYNTALKLQNQLIKNKK
jgi:hypothetical protein